MHSGRLDVGPMVGSIGPTYSAVRTQARCLGEGQLLTAEIVVVNIAKGCRWFVFVLIRSFGRITNF